MIVGYNKGSKALIIIWCIHINVYYLKKIVKAKKKSCTYYNPQIETYNKPKVYKKLTLQLIKKLMNYSISLYCIYLFILAKYDNQTNQ